MTWIILALLAPLFWSFSNYIDKYAVEQQTKSITDFMFFTSILSWVFVPILILIFGLPTITIYSIFPIITGILLTYTYGFYGKSLALGETSTLMLLMGAIPLLTIIFAYLFLEQVMDTQEIFASAIILVGILVVSIEKFALKDIFHKGSGWMMISVITWSGLFVFTDWVLTTMPFTDFFILDTLGTAISGLTLMIIPSMRKKVFIGLKTATKQKFGWFGLNNILDLMGQMCVKKSLALAPLAGVVTLIIQIQSFYLIALGVVLTLLIPQHIKEDISLKKLARKLIGSSIMLVGIAILVLK